MSVRQEVTVREMKLSDFGLMTVPEACAATGWDSKSVWHWIQAGLLPVVVLGKGRGSYFLLSVAGVAAFTPPPRRPRGRPTGSKDSRPRAKRKKAGEAAA